MEIGKRNLEGNQDLWELPEPREEKNPSSRYFGTKRYDGITVRDVLEAIEEMKREGYK